MSPFGSQALFLKLLLVQLPGIRMKLEGGTIAELRKEEFKGDKGAVGWSFQLCHFLRERNKH